MAGNKYDHFPWSHVVGFAFSIILTLFAIWIAFYTDLSVSAIVWSIIGLAILQAGVQLFMFMHVREGEGQTQVATMFYSAGVGVIIVIGTIWVIRSIMSMPM